MTGKATQDETTQATRRDAATDLAGRVPRVEFLDRAGYRQRRFRDAASLLPVVAAVLMILPLMWPRNTPDQSLTSSGMIYLFGLWIVLIIFAFGLSRILRFSGTETGTETGVGIGTDTGGETGPKGLGE